MAAQSAIGPTDPKIIKHHASLKKDTAQIKPAAKAAPVVAAPVKRFVSDILAPLEIPEIEAPEEADALPTPKAPAKRVKLVKKKARDKKDQTVFSRYAVFAFMPALLTMWSVFILLYFGRYFMDVTNLMGGVSWRLALAAFTSLICYLLIWLFIKNWASAAVVAGSQSEQNQHEDHNTWSHLGWARAPRLLGQELVFGLVIASMALAVWWLATIWSPGAIADDGIRTVSIIIAGTLVAWVALLLGVTSLLARYISILNPKKLTATFFDAWQLARRHSAYLVLHFITWLLLGAISYGILGMGLMLASSVRGDWVVYAVAALLASGVLMAAGFGVFSDLYWLKHFQAIATIQTSKQLMTSDKGSRVGGLLIATCIVVLLSVNYWLVWRGELDAGLSAFWPF